MPILGDLPTWAVLLAALLLGAALIVLNIGWFLAAKGWLEQLSREREQRERGGGGPKSGT